MPACVTTNDTRCSRVARLSSAVRRGRVARLVSMRGGTSSYDVREEALDPGLVCGQ